MNDISYSIFLESNSNKEPLRYTLPRRVYAWADDSSTTTCHNCQATFSIFLRRHHCRFCGKIFCYACTNYEANIPKELLTDNKDKESESWYQYIPYFLKSKDKNKHKVCRTCLDTITIINSVMKVINIIQVAKFDLNIIKKMGTVCKLWHYASNYMLSIFREIQYKLINDEYSDIEISLLQNNIHYLSGHNKYLLHLLNICQTPIDFKKAIGYVNTNKRITSCWLMMCHRNCETSFNKFNCIHIIYYNLKKYTNDDLLIYILDLLNHKCTDIEFKCFIPIFMYYLKYDNKTIVNYLLTRCEHNIDLLNALYWELQLYIQDKHHTESYYIVSEKMKQILNNEKNKSYFMKILEGSSVVRMIENISKSIYEDHKKYEEIKSNFNLKNELSCPVYPNIKLKHINLESIIIKNSATRPIIVPFETNTNKRIRLLYKKEDVRKDQIIMYMIKIACDIIKNDENIDTNILLYSVLPITKTSGIIEIVEESETLYYIQEKIKQSMLNYILENNDTKTIKEIRDNLVVSMAFYCIINYLFGIGDRHLDNIMLTKEGKLFHIDFGYIFGKDPVFNNPGIRITQDMIEAIGGVNGKYYHLFIEICSKIYNCLRRYIDIFMIMELILIDICDMGITQLEIRDQVIKRFKPGNTNIDAKVHIVNQLENQSYVDQIKDWFHYHSKEKTISSAMGRFTNALSKIMKPSGS